MKILYVAFQFPFPALKGYQVRSSQQIVYLAKRHQLDLVVLDYKSISSERYEELAPIVQNIHIVKHGKLDFLKGALQSIFNSDPIQKNIFTNKILNTLIRDLTAQKKYDIVHVQMVRLGSVLKHIQDTPIFFDFIDALSLNFHRRSQKELWPMKILLSEEAKRLERYEKKVCEQVSRSSTVSITDSKIINHINPPLVLSHSVDTSQFIYGKDDVRDRDIIFSGNLSYFPNVKAVLSLIQGIMPKIWSEKPDVKLSLVGAFPDDSIVAAAKDLPVEITGFVDDLSECLRSAKIAAIPIDCGSGIQTKVLEAMASGTAVVTTPMVAKTLMNKGCEDKVHMYVAPIGPEFSRLVLDLLERPLEVKRVSNQARIWVEREFGSLSMCTHLENEYEDMVKSISC